MLLSGSVIHGTNGHDRLVSVSDADTLIGGQGFDKYIIDDALDTVIENKNSGYDDIESSVSYTLSANVEGLTLTGSDDLTGTGNELDNVIVGNSGNNVIDGMAGDDELQGGDGNDTLRGGGTEAEQGSDKLFGGLGDDLLIGGTTSSNYLVGEEGNDQLVGGDHGSNWMWGGTGQDTLSGGQEQNSTNKLWGEDGDDVLTGGLGYNELTGGTGNDMLSAIQGSTVNNMWGNAGDDRITGSQGTNTTNYLVGGTGQDTLVGGDDAMLNLLYGEYGDDLLQAGTGNNNTLEGGAGNDAVFGNSGNDMLGGGTGNDALIGNAGADLIYGDEGDDLIYGDGQIYNGSSGDASLTTEADTISGGKGNDTIMGGLGNNVYSFDKGDGQDLILGMSGSDLGADAYAYNTLYFGAGISPDGVSLRWLGDDRIVVSINGTTDSVTIGNFLTSADNMGEAGLFTNWTLNVDRSGVAFIHFDDGTEWDMAAILGRLGAGTTGADALIGTDGANSLSGLAGDDLISAGAGQDTLDGGDGNDTMIGGAGNDVLHGGAGNNTYVFGLGDGNDTIAATSGTPDGVRTNLLYFKADVLPSQVRGYHVGNDLVLSISGTSDSVTIQGFYTSNDPTNTANPVQQVAFLGQTDLTWDLATLAALPLLNGTSGDDTLAGTAGDDVLDGLAGNDVLDGLAGDDVLVGSAGRDTLQGGSGNDFLDGGTGADSLVGGTGDDTYIVDDSGDVVVELDGEGTDTINSTGLNLLVAGEIEQVNLIGSGDQSVVGNAIANTITGNAGHNLIDGGAGNDTLVGGSGNDTLLGNLGADSMVGGQGNDVYRVGDLGDEVIESANEGSDTVEAHVSFTLGAHIEHLTMGGSGNLQATGNELDNRLTGNDGYNVLAGGDGNDTIDGGLGADTLIGGAGNDRYLVNSVADVVTELAGEGTDTVLSSAQSFVATGDVEFIELVGSGNQAVTGSDSANTITGNAGHNLIDGGAGNDTLLGGDGNDSLLGGQGTDSMVGGQGNDLYRVSETGDVVVELAGEGTDTVEAHASFTLGAHIEHLTMGGSGNLQATGNELDNRLTGNDGYNVLAGGDGNDTIDGGLGADTLIGGAGNDRYLVNSVADVVTELAGEGTDTVLSSAQSFVATGDVEFIELVGSGNQAVTGSDSANTITGNAGHNLIDGGAGNDTLLGGDGNDSLLGDIGDDRLVGGRGDDFYRVGQDGDVVIEQSDEGTDTVEAHVSFTLGAHIEHLTMGGSGNLQATGNELDNRLTGNDGYNVLAGGDGNDTIDGGLGADTLIGGAGNDRYLVNSVADVVTELAGEGTDTVLSSAQSFVATGDVEFIELVGSGNQAVTGSDSANTITGNAGHNLIDGGAGNDTLLGGDGNDSLLGDIGDDRLVGGRGDDFYRVGQDGDVVIEQSDEGTDTVEAHVSFTLGAHIEHLTMGGSGNLQATGNELDNRLTGNDGYNVLAGGDGNDTIDGGLGADTLIGGAGNDRYLVNSVADVVTELAGEGTDTVLSSAQSFVATGDVEFIELVGSGNQAVTGSDSANTITGNAGHNLIDGGAGNDTLLGGDGNDSLLGGQGTDSMVGGQGNDLYRVSETGDVVVELAGEGTDTVEAHASFTLGAHIEHLTMGGSGNLQATGNELDNRLTGNDGYNVLAGGDGNDTIDGGLGADTLIGGAGNDRYLVNSVADVVTELAGEGTDTVLSSAQSFVATGDVEFIELVGSGNQAVTGSDSANTITGNAGHNLIDGGAGNDTLLGGDGNDSLLGNAGNDSLIGGLGDDFYRVGSTGDVVVEAAGEGTDTVESNLNSYTLGSNLENLVLANGGYAGYGNALDNTITGNSMANFMAGGTGNDTYVIDRGSKADVIRDTDATAGNTDVVRFGTGIAADQLWFRHVGNDLAVSIIGTSDSVTIRNWYNGSQNHVEQFMSADGQMLLDSAVDNLVNAMASFSPPAAGQTTLPSNYQASLAAVIAANWS